MYEGEFIEAVTKIGFMTQFSEEPVMHASTPMENTPKER
jgi:hypothetical protein